jgi:hypothetical protein
MSDDKFTKTAASLLTGMRDLVDWGIEGGHTTPDQLRLAVIPRKAIPELKKKGLSNRKIAKLTGVDDKTVAADLRAANSAENAEIPRSVQPAIPAGEFETIVIDPPWPMTKSSMTA